ncbi:MAG TPA: TlpA disulfide reductase family protein [Pseudoneobacillus sp.]|nr:TlpA disulfide reductase family protein [Pseudoneobacillus sp.]
MNKNLLSIAIIILAIAIIIVNFFWNPMSTEKTNENSEVIPKEFENTSGVDLSQELEGNPAPDFTLTTLDGKTVKLSDYKGKKVILNFWATWCPPCKAEMPHMQKFYEKNKENNIEILAVNLTNLDNGKKSIEEFVTEYKLTFDIPLDEEGTIGMQYQAFAVPTSYIIDSKGIITKKIVGPMDENMMETFTKNIE